MANSHHLVRGVSKHHSACWTTGAAVSYSPRPAESFPPAASRDEPAPLSRPRLPPVAAAPPRRATPKDEERLLGGPRPAHRHGRAPLLLAALRPRPPLLPGGRRGAPLPQASSSTAKPCAASSAATRACAWPSWTTSRTWTRSCENPLVIELKLYERTARSAVTDGLTGLFNHAYFKDALRREVQRAHRHGLKFCLALFDLDDFKRLNDTKGHLAGDRVLVKAAALRQGERAGDRRGRAVWRRGVRRSSFPRRRDGRLRGGGARARAGGERTSGGVRGPKVTRLGRGSDVAGRRPQTADDLVRKADQALYRAKAQGKNQVARARSQTPRLAAGSRPAAREARKAGPPAPVADGPDVMLALFLAVALQEPPTAPPAPMPRRSPPPMPLRASRPGPDPQRDRLRRRHRLRRGRPCSTPSA